MEQVEGAQDTLRDTIQASIAAVTQENEPAEIVTPEPSESAAQRARDEVGRFAKTSADAGQKALNDAKGQPAPVVTELNEPAAQPIPRPSSWSKEMWPLWDKLNTGAALTAQEARQVAEYNAKRETQFATGVSTYKQIADNAKPLLDAIQPFQEDMQRHGIQAPEMVHRLMSAHKSLSMGSPQEKLQQFATLAQQYGIPLQAFYDQAAQQQYLATPHQPQQQAPQQPPNFEAMIEKTLQQRELNQTIESMQRDTTKYPFFNYVRSTMAQLLETGAANDLDDAYQKSLDAPEHAMLSTAMATQQSQAAEAQRVAAAQTTARIARANTISPRSSTPAVPAASGNGKKSVRESLSEAMEMHRSSARI